MNQTPAIWSWHSQFGSDDGPGLTTSSEHCGFAYGDNVVQCEIEGVPDQTGELQVSAVQGVCPKCDTGFRLDPMKSPFVIEAREVQLRSSDGPKRFRPLSVYVPVTCDAKLAAINDVGVTIGTGVCDWRVVIRKGVAHDMNQVRVILPQAIAEAQRSWSEAAKAISRKNAGQQWQAVLNGVWQQALPGIQAIQTGNYERSGPKSIVGAWDMIDHVIVTAQGLVAQLR